MGFDPQAPERRSYGPLAEINARTQLEIATTGAALISGLNAEAFKHAVFGSEQEDGESSDQLPSPVSTWNEGEDFQTYATRVSKEFQQAAMNGLRVIAEVKGWSPNYLIAMAGWREKHEADENP